MMPVNGWNYPKARKSPILLSSQRLASAAKRLANRDREGFSGSNFQLSGNPQHEVIRGPVSGF